MTTAVMATATATLDEYPPTASVNPDSAAIDAPGAALDAACLGKLAHEIGRTPIYVTAVVTVVVASAFDPVAATAVTRLRCGLDRGHHQNRSRNGSSDCKHFRQHAPSPL
jgi:hypothetical protein